MAMDVIDYEIFGRDMQYVEIELDPGEAAIGEAGAMMMMEDGIQMDTVFGDGSANQGSGLFGKLMGAGKRLLTGESLFTTIFHNEGHGKRRVAFAAPYPGQIVPVQLSDVGGTLMCQKDAFLCAARGVSLGIGFQKKLGAGLFGGEGFILQKLEGDGLAFFHAGGALAVKQLAAGETLRVDTGCVAAFESTVDFDIQYVGKVKSALFSGEGLFTATLRGPGRVWIQSLPLSRLADRIVQSAPSAGGQSREEGSLLGGLGRLIDGD
ncbi:TIGR00266 family protein [Niveibacterium sp. SC-1]|uniref:TIGR00266 family protein n=1 Tax=Niveibacterium sp. SC-1 TaxID=3135646 RepID=UPI00311F057A